MLMLEFVKWWYGSGWVGVISNVRSRLERLADMFSLAILLRTLFSPWRRIITYPGAGLDAHIKALIDNLVSRFIGFFVRVGVLVIALCMFVVFAIVSLLQVVTWPVVPILAVGLIIWGVV